MDNGIKWRAMPAGFPPWDRVALVDVVLEGSRPTGRGCFFGRPSEPRAPDLGTSKITNGTKPTSWRMIKGEACLARSTCPVRHALDHCGLVAPASGEGAEGLGRGPALESLVGRRHHVGIAAPYRCAAV
ncbi:hypothetical protein [Streptomyces chartreusis]